MKTPISAVNSYKSFLRELRKIFNWYGYINCHAAHYYWRFCPGSNDDDKVAIETL